MLYFYSGKKKAALIIHQNSYIYTCYQQEINVFLYVFFGIIKSSN